MRPFAFAFAFVLAHSVGFAQQLDLPGHTGGLTPDPTWTVLRTKDIVAEERATDPTGEPARTGLRNLLAQLRSEGLADGRIVLHALGPEDQLRVVHAYSVPGGATTRQLCTPTFHQQVRSGIEDRSAKAGVQATFQAATPTSLCDVGGVRIRYAMANAEAQWMVDLHIVPAHPSTQYFVANYSANDAAAPIAVDALVASFTGAKEPPPSGFADAQTLGTTGVVLLAASLAMMLLRSKRDEEGKRRRRRRASK